MTLADLFPYWGECCAGLLAAIEHLSPQELAWVPPGGKNSIGWLAAHIARIYDRDVGQRLLGRPPLLDEGWTPRTAGELAAPLRELHADLHEYLAGGKPDELGEPRGGRPVQELLWNALIEELHHRGQIFLLLRLLGRQPPAV